MKIGVLTGGGDCPGLNAAIRAVTRRAIEYGYEVMGIKNGWAGLVNGDAEPLTMKDVSGILHLGGTVLGTSRTNPARKEADMERVVHNMETFGIDALVAIGGDDTLSVAKKLYDRGCKVVGVPKTMDNDINGTDYCIGFDSAVSIVADALDKLHTTASSHHRVIVLEVMGRDAGWVAVVGGLAGGADFVVVPEVPVEVETICNHLARRRTMGKTFSLIVISEGATVPGVEDRDLGEVDAFGHVRLDKRNVGELLAREIEKRTGMETRVTVLGHLQRGGSPTVFDRVLATRVGIAAVDLIKEGRFGLMPALRGNQIEPITLAEAVSRNRTVDLDLYKLAETFY